LVGILRICPQRSRACIFIFTCSYNEEHRHSGIKIVTPAERHAGLGTDLLSKRAQVYDATGAKHPERWSGATRNWEPIYMVHLNPEKSIQEAGHLKLKMPA
jgi:hypothetical protein